MANTAAYELNVTGTDDETFAFAVSFELADGTAFPFDDYAIEYALSGESGRLTLTQGDGITVRDSVVTFTAARGALRPGLYGHGCRVRHLTLEHEVQVFDGTVTIGEGFFR
jgi:hypothetical protein